MNSSIKKHNHFGTYIIIFVLILVIFQTTGRELKKVGHLFLKDKGQDENCTLIASIDLYLDIFS